MQFHHERCKCTDTRKCTDDSEVMNHQEVPILPIFFSKKFLFSLFLFLREFPFCPNFPTEIFTQPRCIIVPKRSWKETYLLGGRGAGNSVMIILSNVKVPFPQFCLNSEIPHCTVALG